MLIGLTIAVAVIGCGVFALAATGREGFSELEIRNLRKAAVMSAVGAAVAFALVVWQLV